MRTEFADARPLTTVIDFVYHFCGFRSIVAIIICGPLIGEFPLHVFCPASPLDLEAPGLRIGIMPLS